MNAFSALTLASVAVLFASLAAAEETDPGDGSRTGEFQLTQTVADVAGADSAAAMTNVIAADNPFTWRIFVPQSYRPEIPAGLLIYVSPSSSGKIPPSWKPVLEEHNLIWIAADDSGNRVRAAHRAALALLAPTLARKHYRIDPERIYVSGFSGGGKVAGKLASGYPGLFRGALYICGIDSLHKDPPRQVEPFRENRFVFLSGTKDSALEETRRTHRQYRQAGVENSKLMVIRNMGHRIPDAADFAEAVRYLDPAVTGLD